MGTMGIFGKLTPEKAQVAMAIATAMAKKCHDCQYSLEEKAVFTTLKAPNMDCAECQACIAAIKGAINGTDC